MSSYPTTWNLTPFYQSDNDPKIEQDKKRVLDQSYQFIKKWQDRSDYLAKPSVLKEALDDYNRWLTTDAQGGPVFDYFHLRTAQEQNNPTIKAKLNQVIEVMQKIDVDLQFFLLRLSRISPETQTQMLTAPELKTYHYFLKKLFEQAKHLLSEPEERILTLKQMTSYVNWTRTTLDLLSKEEGEVLGEDGTKTVQPFSVISQLMNSQQKSVRDQAALIFNQLLHKHTDLAEIEINAVMADKKINDQLRGYSRPDQARHLSEDWPDEMVDTLVETVAKRFDQGQRYYGLKAKLFGVSQLEYHERNVPFGSLDKTYPFEEAVSLVQSVFATLDPEFTNILNSFLTNGQIDVFPAKGKTGGGFCSSILPVYPTYVLLNHTDKLQDVLTFAHEMGHAINSELLRKAQPAIYFDTFISCAEVASTFMEDFVLEAIRQDASPELELAILMMKLNEDISTIHRQIASNRFEREIHKAHRETGYVSLAELGDLYQHHMHAYMGESVNKSEGSQHWWLYVPHYRNYFYNFQYSCGQLISKALQRMVREDGKTIVKVKDFFKAGTTDSPRNIFLKMGIDIAKPEFWNEGLDEIEATLNETEALAKKLGKI